MHSLLTDILDYKRREIAALYQEIQQQPAALLAQVLQGEYVRPLQERHRLLQALQNTSFAIIAEFKRCSPTQTKPVVDHTLESQLQEYLQHQATAISLITESSQFQGSLADAAIAVPMAKSYGIPLLRKDFILDEIQIAQSIVAGFSAILLIVSITGMHTRTLYQQARTLGIDVLVEVHTLSELQEALAFGAEIIGINNRNLKTFNVDPEHALRIKRHVPGDIKTIAESGIRTAEQAQHYRAAGFSGLLVGSALMQASHPGQLLTHMLGNQNDTLDSP